MAQVPITTIVPFADTAQLPPCAVSCGPLYDANGACVPPAVPTNSPAIYTSCFCRDPRVAAFSSTTGGVCDNACAGNPNGFSSITSWFHSICNVQGNGAPNPGAPTPTAGSSGGGDWISNHWQWVIMLVVLVVAIAGIWIGACIWRRRYLRKRDLLKPAGAPGLPPSESATTGAGIPMTYSNQAGQTPALPTFVSTADEKRKSKGKKWFVGRT